MFTLAEFIKIMPTTATSDKQATLTIVLALATLGCTTQIGLFLFLVASPKVDKARTYSVAVANVFTKITLPI
jgi:heme/copper-type cytochrome/quinol oxidase subunit 4